MVAVVDAAMERAVRAVTVERGVDPSGLALVAFGGAGPLHACAVADALGMAAVVVPPRAGVLSAVGLLCSPRQRDLVRSWPTPSDHAGLAEAAASLADEARFAVGGDGGTEHRGRPRRPRPCPTRPAPQWMATPATAALPTAEALPDEARPPVGGGELDAEVTTAVDCRYAGQSHELTVPSPDDFPAEHRRRNGYARPDAPVEVVAIRARARRPPPLAITDLPPPSTDRRPTAGPTVVVEPDCTVWIPDGLVGHRRRRRQLGAPQVRRPARSGDGP